MGISVRNWGMYGSLFLCLCTCECLLVVDVRAALTCSEYFHP